MWNKDERTTRNCYNAIPYDGRVYCKFGHKISPHTEDGSISQLQVERYKSLLGYCADCQDFEGDEEVTDAK